MDSLNSLLFKYFWFTKKNQLSKNKVIIHKKRNFKNDIAPK